MTGAAAPDALTLRLPVALASVEQARRAVLAYAGGEALSPRARTTVELVLEEVVMNLVRHAFDDPGGQYFDLRATVDGSTLRLHVVDSGRRFDPTAHASRPMAPTLEDAEPGGLGLPLLRRRTRAMHHAWIDGHNVLTLDIDLALVPAAGTAHARAMPSGKEPEQR